MGADILKKVNCGNQTHQQIYRYAVIAKIFGIEINEEELSLKKLDNAPKGVIKNRKMKDYTGDLLLLYGADVITDELIEEMYSADDLDLYDEIHEAMQYMIDNNDKDDADKISPKDVETILRCCKVYKTSEGVKSVSFGEALNILGNLYVTFYNGAVMITDKKFSEFMFNIHEPMGCFDQENRLIKPENDEYIKKDTKADKFVPGLDENIPCVLDLKRLPELTWLYGKPYSTDFYDYIKKNGMPFDGIEKRYDDYIKQHKLHFEVYCYLKKRDICKGIVNHFDYVDVAGKSEMTPDKSQIVNLKLSAESKECDNDCLTEKVFELFKMNSGADENAAVKIIHDDSEKWYVIRNGRLVRIDMNEFFTELYDFNNVWTVMQELSRTGKITINGNTLVLPQDICYQIPSKDMKYAHEILKEQYRLNEKHKKGNKLLSALKADAQKEYQELQKTKAAQENNAAKRKDSVEGMNG